MLVLKHSNRDRSMTYLHGECSTDARTRVVVEYSDRPPNRHMSTCPHPTLALALAFNLGFHRFIVGRVLVLNDPRTRPSSARSPSWAA